MDWSGAGRKGSGFEDWRAAAARLERRIDIVADARAKDAVRISELELEVARLRAASEANEPNIPDADLQAIHETESHRPGFGEGEGLSREAREALADPNVRVTVPRFGA